MITVEMVICAQPETFCEMRISLDFCYDLWFLSFDQQTNRTSEVQCWAFILTGVYFRPAVYFRKYGTRIWYARISQITVDMVICAQPETFSEIRISLDLCYDLWFLSFDRTDKQKKRSAMLNFSSIKFRKSLMMMFYYWVTRLVSHEFTNFDW